MDPGQTSTQSEGGGRDDVSRLLRDIENGVVGASERLFPLLYRELHDQAVQQMNAQRRDHTLQPTALVNEAYIKLVSRAESWKNRRHFLAVAATAMRQILVDHARGKSRKKRAATRVPMDGVTETFEEAAYDLVALDDALRLLADQDETAAKVVELRFFGGLTVEQASIVLDTSIRTVERNWTLAKAWLHREMRRA